MKVTLKIQRFDPPADQKPRWGTYVAEVEESARVLDALHYVKWYLDGSLALRRSCAHGVCGSDAMVINGVNRLACKVLCRTLRQPVTVEPLLDSIVAVALAPPASFGSGARPARAKPAAAAIARVQTDLAFIISSLSGG